MSLSFLGHAPFSDLASTIGLFQIRQRKLLVLLRSGILDSGLGSRGWNREIDLVPFKATAKL